MVANCVEIYRSMEGEFDRLMASCRRTLSMDSCSQEDKEEIEVKFEGFVKKVGEFSDAAFDTVQWI